MPVRLFADTNIFGIAVDPGDERRLSVWNTLEEVATGDTLLTSAGLVLKEMKENPHKPTREKELELYNILVNDTYALEDEA
jgi:hypothetical protein